MMPNFDLVKQIGLKKQLKLFGTEIDKDLNPDSSGLEILLKDSGASRGALLERLPQAKKSRNQKSKSIDEEEVIVDDKDDEDIEHESKKFRENEEPIDLSFIPEDIRSDLNVGEIREIKGIEEIGGEITNEQREEMMLKSQSFAVVSSGPKLSKTARVRHQISSLYQNYREQAPQLAANKVKGKKTKADTAAKYGW